MLTQPFLIFSMQLDNTPQLNQGRLVLYDWERGHIGRWVATSGLGQYQRIGGWSKQGGGVCPASYQCNPTFANHWVQVAPIDLRHVKGVEGNGYPITPFEVTTKDGVERSDLLIHRDVQWAVSSFLVMSSQTLSRFSNLNVRDMIRSNSGFNTIFSLGIHYNKSCQAPHFSNLDLDL